MIILPAIDIKDGQCVRLVQGEAQRKTVYGDDPLAMAFTLQEAGARRLHVVDLDGAFDGASPNLLWVGRMARELAIPIEVGGGIRSREDIQHRLEELGVGYVILGTVATEDPALVEWAAARYGERIIAGIDAKDDKVAVKGWVQTLELHPVTFAQQLAQVGVRSVVYTDISRDGMLTGPNLSAMRAMVAGGGMAVTASGGVSCLADLEALSQTGVAAAIVGKAMYDGRLDIREAIQKYDV